MRFAFVLLFFGLLGCSTPEERQFDIFSESYDFSKNMWGWDAEFTDYPVSETDEYAGYNWTAEYAQVPPNIGSQMALRLSCENVSGDVFMFIKKKVTGLKPNTNYSLVFDIELVSNALAGQGVVLKAGASFVEPQKVLHNDRFELNIDKGASVTSGNDVIVIGDLGAPFEAVDYSYSIITNAGATQRFTATTNNAGELWLIVGTESSYPGQNTVYYTRIDVVFSAT